MATRRQSYHKVVRDLRAEFDLSLAEARLAWRHLRDALGRSPFGTDLDRHPRIAAREVRRARLGLIVKVPPLGPRLPPVGGEIVPEDFDEYEVTATTKGHTPGRGE